MVRTNLSLPEELWELVRAEAFTRKVSQTCVVREALREHYQRPRKRCEPDEDIHDMANNRQVAEPYVTLSKGGVIIDEYPSRPVPLPPKKKKPKDELPKLVARRV
jgi:hypothetical protein